MPTQNQGHIDVLLSNVSVAYQQDQNNFIASRIFPDVSVAKQSDKYAVIPAGDFNRDEMQRRADGAESAGGDFELSTDSYFANVYAFHKNWGEQTEANMDDQFNFRQNITNYLTMKALLKKEKYFASNFFTTGKWTKDLTGVSAAPSTNQFLQWNDAASDPIGDITKAITTQQILTGGFRPNTLVLGRQVLDVLEIHPDVIDRVKYGTQTDVSIATVSHLRQLFKVDNIFVMEAIENTANKGQTAVNAFIGGKSALLLYRTTSPGTLVPTAGYTFSWSGLTGQAGMGTRVLSYQIPLTAGGKRLEIEMAWDMKMIAPDFGTFFATAVA
jgi:hypothetical protein